MHPLTRIRQNLCTIRERYGVARIGIFGSVARNEATAASDIDILVEFREGEETFDHFMDLKFYLEDLPGRKADLVIINTLKPRIRKAALCEVAYAWRSCAPKTSPCLLSWQVKGMRSPSRSSRTSMWRSRHNGRGDLWRSISNGSTS